MMAARLERYIYCCSLRRFNAGLKRVPFSMKLTILFVAPFSYNSSVLYNNSSYKWFGDVKPVAFFASSIARLI